MEEVFNSTPLHQTHSLPGKEAEGRWRMSAEQVKEPGWWMGVGWQEQDWLSTQGEGHREAKVPLRLQNRTGGLPRSCPQPLWRQSRVI